MSTETELRMAARRKNQKDNFVGADIKKARRVSEMRNRQKEKRRSVWDQGREGLDNLEEDPIYGEVPRAAQEPKQDDRRQMLLQWKKKRDEQTARMKSFQPKPFKAGSRNVGAPVPLPSVTAVCKPTPKPIPKPVTKPVPHQFMQRSVRSSTRAQRIESKENVKPIASKAKGTRAAKEKKGTATSKATSAVSKPLAELPTESNAAEQFTFAKSAFGMGMGAAPAALDKFATIFPGGEFSPFKFNFRKNLDGTGLVTVRGEKPATPPAGLPSTNSPALWPNSPENFWQGGSPTKSPSSCHKKKQQRLKTPRVRAVQEMSRASPSPLAQGKCSNGAASQSSSPPLEQPTGTSPCVAKLANLELSSPQSSGNSSPPSSSSPVNRVSQPYATHGEVSSSSSTSSCDEPEPQVAEIVACVSAPFRQTMDATAVELHSLANTWDATVNDLRQEVSEDIIGRIDTAIGQARLLIRERFKQFSKLCDGADNPVGDKLTHASDLEGFWEMISFQIDDVRQKFSALQQLKEADWQVASKTPKKKLKTKKIVKKKTPAKAAAAARERMRKFRMAKKQEMEAAAAVTTQEDDTPSASTEAITTATTPEGKTSRNSTTPRGSAAKPQRTPRGSLLQSPIARSARKRSMVASTIADEPQQQQEQQGVVNNATAGFDFAQYIAPMSASKQIKDWQSAWLASSATGGGCDLMSFSPLASGNRSTKKIKAIRQADSPSGAFVRSLAPCTPSNSRRSKVASICSLNNHVVMTPVRRSLRLMHTPYKDDGMPDPASSQAAAAGGVAALPDLAEYSVWPNMALD